MQPEIRIESLKPEHLEQVVSVLKDSFGTKRVMGIFCHFVETVKVLEFKYSKFPQEKWDIGAVAVEGEGNRVLGYVQMDAKGLPSLDELHECKKETMYIERIAVSAEARGKGIGTRLLKWCEQKARECGKTSLGLDVVKGNRAIGLYERFGFVVVVVTDPIHLCIDRVFTFCLLGRPYGMCSPWWGSHYMIKDLS